MNKQRIIDLQKSETELTEEEVKQGWHFCPDFDDLLIGPGNVEAFVCNCSLSSIEEWKKTEEAKELYQNFFSNRYLDELSKLDQELGLI
jgi:hypothetical protein